MNLYSKRISGKMQWKGHNIGIQIQIQIQIQMTEIWRNICVKKKKTGPFFASSLPDFSYIVIDEDLSE